ncbi:P-loop containing nucleoside triphosphate hydrolase protein [Cokeromyces recurvatus]|uniref:P-loop containing nucleoside triphosphate hydrolase protein n=1 Tax=Cokeromyces recurvatus TaxID=90255 RepID=UPI00221FCDE1|nr:P-loop containing nucleoside triphosphate hydrolase protein [Cokeromyces recurvatus]KAI7906099.1 P-loop containing nucleoside triphosphate hydrolase protein [Cokeromyces recurvatus]
MPPKSTKQRSIKDHFSAIPKKENQIEEEKEIKIHPLFLSIKQRKEQQKSTSAILKDETNNSLKVLTTTTTTMPIANTSLIKKPNLIVRKEPMSPIIKETVERRMKRKINKQRNPFESIIKADVHHFYSTQKEKRNKTIESSPSHKMKQALYLDLHTIEERMNVTYQNDWKKEPCCRWLFDNLTRLRNRDDKRILWSDKYRPDSVEGLIGFLPDFEYLRDWLNRLKIKPPLLTNSKKYKQKGKKWMDIDDERLCNLMLLVGGNGVGKTATVYTAAKETGYSVFEMNPSSRRTGKDVFDNVGEMIASHLVQFDGQRKRKTVEGERIIIRDTVIKKKPKTIDIAQHFKRLLNVSQQPKEEESQKITEEEEENQMITEEGEESRIIIENNKKETIKPTIQDFFKKMEDRNREKEEIEEPKQSLVLLEEVDILFEEDKGFWTSVIELSQKSKRPIIMTCNDKSQIPLEQLYLQSVIYFERPERTSLVPYLQLICYTENYIIDQEDILYLCELLDYNIRQIIDTLQFWLNDEKMKIDKRNEHVVFKYLFAHIMGFADLIKKKDKDQDVLVELMDRLKGLNSKTIGLCKLYYFTVMNYNSTNDDDIEKISDIMNTESFIDAYIGLTDKQRHQIYDIDQYDTKDLCYHNMTILLKKANDLDHWELGELIGNSISIINLSQEKWRNHYLSTWSNQWKGREEEDLYDESQTYLKNCLEIIYPSILNNPSQYLYKNVIMIEYMPEIRNMCIYDKGIAGKGKKERTRKRIRYFNQLDDESRNYLIQ